MHDDRWPSQTVEEAALRGFPGGGSLAAAVGAGWARGRGGRRRDGWGGWCGGGRRGRQGGIESWRRAGWVRARGRDELHGGRIAEEKLAGGARTHRDGGGGDPGEASDDGAPPRRRAGGGAGLVEGLGLGGTADLGDQGGGGAGARGRERDEGGGELGGAGEAIGRGLGQAAVHGGVDAGGHRCLAKVPAAWSP